MNEKKETIYFAAGCFWGVEKTFSKLPGVLETKVGYMGGEKQNPTYEEVCSGNTGHAETVKVVYDSSKISCEKLLNIFWDIHDPTSLDKQGLDVGSQYRSAIFYTTQEQKDEAEKAKVNKNQELENKIVTEIQKADTFWQAEEYHQKYLEKTGKSVC